MSANKTWMQNEWDTNRKVFLDPDKGLYEIEHSQTPSITPDEIDETVGRLLAAIEQAQFELTQGWYIEAKITLHMALEEHKGRLAQSLTIPAHISQLWSDMPDDDSPLWESESDA